MHVLFCPRVFSGFCLCRLQLHIKRHQTDSDDPSVKPCSADEASSEDTDDVDAALNELQSSLEGQNNDQKSKNLAQYPELKDYHMFLKYASII